jgi:hypothetical protein
LFGGESVSLRFINNLDECLGPAISAKDGIGASSKLVDLLLSKMPTISKTSAEQFVSCFLAAADCKGKDAIAAVAQITGPISLMMQAALCTEECEAGIDFPDFVSSATGIPRAYDGPPALRMAAWCCHMRAAGDATVLQSMAPPATIFDPMLVDQYGFPLQLKANAASSFLSEGLAFSWNGDYSRISDIIDAVWALVVVAGRKCALFFSKHGTAGSNLFLQRLHLVATHVHII